MRVKDRILEFIGRHADDRGRLDISYSEMQTRFGLSRHDLVKNLDQLQCVEGRIKVRRRRIGGSGYIDRVTLVGGGQRNRPPP